MGRDTRRRRRGTGTWPSRHHRTSLAVSAALAALWFILNGLGLGATAAPTGAFGGLPQADLPLLLDMERTSPEGPAVTAAKALLAEGRWQQALDVLTPIISAGSTASAEDRAHGLMLAALALSGSGRVEQAVALLKEAAALNPGSLVIRLNLARIYADAGLLPEATAALRQTAAALRAIGRLPEAADAYTRGIELLGDAAPVGLLLEAGFVHLSLEEFDAARRLFEQALQRSPSELEALYGLGVAEAGLGRPDEARRHLEQVVQRSPWHWRAHFALGVALATLGDLAGAQREYEEAVRLAPAVQELRTTLGQLYLELGRYRDAEGQLQAALALGDGRPEVLYAIGRAQFLDARPAEAAASFGRAAALEAGATRKALYLYAQALAVEAAGDVPGALRLLQQAVALDSASFDAQLRLGELLLARGEAASAIAPLEKAAALRPGDPRVQRALEAARRHAGHD